MRNWLKNEYVVLSGASGGIGRELCKILIERYGARVIGIGRNEEKMRSLSQELGENAENFSYYLFDVSEKSGWENLKKELIAKEISPKLLINNAGAFPAFIKAMDTPFETSQRILRVNYFSILHAVNALSSILKDGEKDRAGIVNISSSAALCTVVGTSAYSASKAAVKAYTEALQMEEKGKKYVGLICPGTTATELFDGDENTKNSILQKVAMPAGKMAKKISRKILKKRKRAVLGFDAKMMAFTTKLMPTKGLFLIRGVMKASKSKVFSNVFNEKKEK